MRTLPTAIGLVVGALGFIAARDALASEWVTIRTEVDARSFAGDWIVSTSKVAGRNDYYVKHWNGSSYADDTESSGLPTSYVAGTTITVSPNLSPAMIMASGAVFTRQAHSWTALTRSKCGVTGTFAARRSNGTLRSYLAYGLGSPTPTLFAIADGANDTPVYYLNSASNCWQLTNLSAEQVAIAPNGTPWAVTSAQSVYSFNLTTGVWSLNAYQTKKIGGNASFVVKTTGPVESSVVMYVPGWSFLDDTYRDPTYHATVNPDAVFGYWDKSSFQFPEFVYMVAYSKTERKVRAYTLSD